MDGGDLRSWVSMIKLGIIRTTKLDTVLKIYDKIMGSQEIKSDKFEFKMPGCKHLRKTKKNISCQTSLISHGVL